MLSEGRKEEKELAQRGRGKPREFNLLLLLNEIRVKTSVETSDCILSVESAAVLAWLSPAPVYREGIRAVVGCQPAAQGSCVLCA